MRNSVAILFTFFLTCSINAQENFVNVFEEPHIEKLSSIIWDLELKKGNAKSVIPVNLPENCKGWYYSITIAGKNKYLKEDNQLIKQLISQHQATGMSGGRLANHLSAERSGKASNIYIVDGSENARSFVNYYSYTYLEKHIETKSMTGYMENDQQKDYFIGIENPYDLKGVKVKVEVVALME